MRKEIVILFILVSFTFEKVSAQNRENNSYEVIERIAESYADDADDETDLTMLLENLERILESPININNATRLQLEELFFLSSFQIESLLSYRKQVGQIYSIYELQSLNGFNEELISNLEAFLVFLAPEIQTNAYFKQELNIRYAQKRELADGFIADENGEKDYAGIKPGMLLKYSAQKGDKYSFGITAENDSGEEFFNGTNKFGFDFYSGYVGFSGKKILKQVYIGDYVVKTGQGIIQWSNYGIRKSTETNKIRLSGQGLRASSSTDENKYMRGIATNFELGDFELITFYSNTNVDANIIDFDENGNIASVSSLQTSGYHRTEGENYDENALNVQQAGVNLKYRFNQFSIGVNGVYKKLEAPLVLSDYPYNIYNFSGDNNYNLSTDFLWVMNKVNFFGEAAYSKSGGKAIVAGMEAVPASEIALSFLYRDYSADFQSINGRSFAESSKNTNERGFYSGIAVYPLAHFKLSAYYDIYESYWLKFNTNSPVRGNDFIMQTDFNPSRKLSMYVRLKSEVNFKKESTTDQLKNDINQRISRLRYHVGWDLSDAISLKFRAEWAGYSIADSMENGLLLFADFSVKPSDKFSATARFAWFNTDGYNSRIYAYENDVPQYFYIPALYDKGVRYYFNANYKITESLTAYIKLSQLLYFDNSIVIGSANSAQNDNKKTDFKIHLKYRF